MKSKFCGLVVCCQGVLRWVEANVNKTGDCSYLVVLDHEAACTGSVCVVSQRIVGCLLLYLYLNVVG